MDSLCFGSGFMTVRLHTRSCPGSFSVPRNRPEKSRASKDPRAGLERVEDGSHRPGAQGKALGSSSFSSALPPNRRSPAERNCVLCIFMPRKDHSNRGQRAAQTGTGTERQRATTVKIPAAPFRLPSQVQGTDSPPQSVSRGSNPRWGRAQKTTQRHEGPVQAGSGPPSERVGRLEEGGGP